MQHAAGFLAVLALVATGCKKHEAAPPQPGGTMGSASGAPSGQTASGDNMTPEPVGHAPAPLPAPPQDVQAPTAADLATFTKSLPGKGDKLTATIDTSEGTIHCDLFGDKAPIAVASFIGLATGQQPWRDPKTGDIQKGKPYFDGITCHRVIPEFMMQCGDPTGTGTGGPGYTFDNEIDKSLSMKAGALAMANTGQPNSDGSQFFILEVDRPQLMGGYTIFGQCKEVDVVKKVTHVPVLCATSETNPCTPDTGDRPKTPVVIKKITIARE